MLNERMFYRFCIGLLIVLTSVSSSAVAGEPTYDLVIAGGRVVDPETGYDRVASIGIIDGRVARITDAPLNGLKLIDASGLVVAPGFVDLHAHGQDIYSVQLKALDGVTTQMDLEAGAWPVADYYNKRQNRWPVNYGTSVGHVFIRMQVMGRR